jgi:hypothetical protein
MGFGRGTGTRLPRACERKSVEALWFEARWRPADLDQVPEDAFEIVRILDDRDDFHLRAALRTDQRVDFIYLGEKTRPGTFT